MFPDLNPSISDEEAKLPHPSLRISFGMILYLFRCFRPPSPLGPHRL